MEEVWKSCVGWEDFYEISCFGNVRSKKRPVPTRLGISTRGGITLKKLVASNGYQCVNLTGGGKRKQEHVHTLVLNAFVGSRPDGHQCCHNDGNRQNNVLSNLRWDSIKNNHADKIKHGTHQSGSKNPTSKLTEEQAKYVKYSKKPLKEIAKELGVSFGCVDKIRYGQTWKHV